MNSTSLCKADFFNIYKSFFYEVFGSEVYRSFAGYLPTSVKLLFAKSENDSSEFISGRILNTLFASTDIHIIPQVDDFMFEFGVYFVHSPLFAAVNDSDEEFVDFSGEYNISYPENLQGRILRDFAEFTSRMKIWFQPLNLGLDGKHSQNELSVFLSERLSPLPIFCDFISGALNGFAEIYHIPNYTVTETECIFEGYDKCKFSIKWNSSEIDL